MYTSTKLILVKLQKSVALNRVYLFYNNLSKILYVTPVAITKKSSTQFHKKFLINLFLYFDLCKCVYVT